MPMLSHINPVKDHHVTATKYKDLQKGKETIRVRKMREGVGDVYLEQGRIEEAVGREEAFVFLGLATHQALGNQPQATQVTVEG